MSFPDPDALFANEYGTSVFLKNVITALNIEVGDFTYYDSARAPADFEKTNILFNYLVFGDHLRIGKFCQLAHGTTFVMGAANHRLSSVSTYPFKVMGKEWSAITPAHLSELPRKGDTVVGNDVWFGRESVVMPGIHIGDGAIIAAYSVVVTDIPPYTVYGGNPARFIRERFDSELKELLLDFKWWDLKPEELLTWLPLIVSPDLEITRQALKDAVAGRRTQI